MIENLFEEEEQLLIQYKAKYESQSKRLHEIETFYSKRGDEIDELNGKIIYLKTRSESEIRLLEEEFNKKEKILINDITHHVENINSKNGEISVLKEELILKSNSFDKLKDELEYNQKQIESMLNSEEEMKLVFNNKIISLEMNFDEIKSKYENLDQENKILIFDKNLLKNNLNELNSDLTIKTNQFNSLNEIKNQLTNKIQELKILLLSKDNHISINIKDIKRINNENSELDKKITSGQLSHMIETIISKIELNSLENEKLESISKLRISESKWESDLNFLNQKFESIDEENQILKNEICKFQLELQKINEGLKTSDESSRLIKYENDCLVSEINDLKKEISIKTDCHMQTLNNLKLSAEFELNTVKETLENGEVLLKSALEDNIQLSLTNKELIIKFESIDEENQNLKNEICKLQLEFQKINEGLKTSDESSRLIKYENDCLASEINDLKKEISIKTDCHMQTLNDLKLSAEFELNTVKETLENGEVLLKSALEDNIQLSLTNKKLIIKFENLKEQNFEFVCEIEMLENINSERCKTLNELINKFSEKDKVYKENISLLNLNIKEIKNNMETLKIDCTKMNNEFSNFTLKMFRVIDILRGLNNSKPDESEENQSTIEYYNYNDEQDELDEQDGHEKREEQEEQEEQEAFKTPVATQLHKTKRRLGKSYLFKADFTEEMVNSNEQQIAGNVTTEDIKKKISINYGKKFKDDTPITTQVNEDIETCDDKLDLLCDEALIYSEVSKKSNQSIIKGQPKKKIKTKDIKISENNMIFVPIEDFMNYMNSED